MGTAAKSLAGKYKMKRNKAALSRFKVSKTGKVKRHHAFTSHLLSARSSKRKRHLRRGAVMSESIAGNVRRLMGMDHKNPLRAAHEKRIRALRAQKKTEAAAKA
jgi:large subunit ribosomal protein L35